MFARQSAKHGGGQQPVSGEIATGRIAGHADGGAAGRKQIRKGTPTRSHYPCLGRDHQTALGVKQGAGDPDRKIWRLQLRLNREDAAKTIRRARPPCPRDMIELGGQDRLRSVKKSGQLPNRVRLQQGAGLFSVAEVRKLPCNIGDPIVEYLVSDPAWLPHHFGGVLGIAERFIAEAAPLAIDLKATLADAGPGDERIVRGSDRAVPLITGQTTDLRAELLAPKDRIALV